MFPTLLDSDQIIFSRAGSFRKGDIIVYREPGGDRFIIHRIIKIHGPEVLTAGDNNSNPDSYFLGARDIIGTVTRIIRMEKVHRVRGGFPGYLSYLYASRYEKRIHRFIICLRPLYLGISVSSPLRRLVAGRCTLRSQFLINPDGGVVIRVFLNKWYVAWIDDQEGVWHIRPPYRLVISESDLPDFRKAVIMALAMKMGEVQS